MTETSPRVRGRRPPRGEPVVDRALSLLEAFDGAHRSLSLGELSRRSAIPTTSALRLASRLVACGALERDEAGRFSIGLRLYEIASLCPRGLDLKRVALPYMGDLAEATRHHVLLAVRDGDDALLVERLSGHHAIPVLYRVGGRLPLHSTGRRARAARVRRSGLPGAVPVATAHPGAGAHPGRPGRAAPDLADVRRERVITFRRKVPQPVMSVATPIFGAQETVVAALSVVVPEQHVDARLLTPALARPRGPSPVASAPASRSGSRRAQPQEKRATRSFLDTLPNGDSGKDSSTSSRSGSLNLAISLARRNVDQLRERRRIGVAGCSDDAGAHPLAQDRVRHRDAGDVLHRRVGQDQVLDLLGADLLAAAVDQVLLAALDHVVAGRVPPHQVARAVEAVGGERAGVVLRRAEVAAQRVGPAAGQLADFAAAHLVAVVVDQPHLVVRADRPAAGLQPHLLRVVEAHEEQHPLRHAEVLLHEAGGDQLLGLQPHLGLHPLAAALDDLHRRQVEVADGGSLTRRISSAGTTLMWVDAVLLDQREHLRPRVLGCSTTCAPCEEVALDARAGERQVVRDRQHASSSTVAYVAHRRAVFEL